VTGGRLLAVTGGHRVDLDAFRTMVDVVCAELGWVWSHATQPAAQQWLQPSHAGAWDAIFLHDLPGLALARGTEPAPHGPDTAVRAAVAELLDIGQGIVATHHTLAGWPAWDGWATALGGRFLYAPGRLRGVERPSSGYRMDTYRVEVVAPGHPVCAGVDAFEVTDELYLCPVFEDEVIALLATDADVSAPSMTSTYDEVRYGRRIPAADQSPGSRLLGWAKAAGRSPLVYLLPGHGPETMAHPAYRRLLANALAWVASPDAREWAAAHPAPLER
jgi:type 1 glutamine amidotransferase